MQPFDLIPEADVRAAVAYTVHLSVRGEVEFRVLRGLANEDVDDVAGACRSEAAKVLAEWARAQSASAPPPTADGPESVRRGHRLFTDPATGCVKCHQDYGRRDAFKYTVWGTPARVADLTRGEFRWGRQPAEIAARVRHGIPAVGMPANPTLSDRDVADLANFVRDAGYPQRLPPDVREKVYPPGR
jgi:mono/diheme cytochrome c family protein